MFLTQEKKTPLHLPQKKKKVIVISGPTASGKTALSLILSKALNGEIISCDSVQIYRGMDIGTAKVPVSIQKEVPHHMIDIRDVDQSFNVVNFYEEAMIAFNDIIARGKTPIIVGGTAFYIHTILYGPPKGPPSDPEIREQLEADYEKFGPEMLYQKLKELDPDHAASITMLDRQKIIRSLEIIAISGMKVSEIPKPSLEDVPQEYDFRCWFTYYPRELLYPRIEERCDQMIKEGLIEEVLQLIPKGIYENSSAARAIGYRQVLDYLQTAQGPEDWENFVRTFK
ncbi:MAG: tRNA (adenosine(37)-N6)-dimethylallyltransferase MiaA, partial [Chlamydiae bacterium]|nr:tRNA (adenosine(37)-N6)-dimethylallyltransferase MiaA [Chlamydiota bacterium]